MSSSASRLHRNWCDNKQSDVNPATSSVFGDHKQLNCPRDVLWKGRFWSSTGAAEFPGLLAKTTVTPASYYGNTAYQNKHPISRSLLHDAPLFLPYERRAARWVVGGGNLIRMHGQRCHTQTLCDRKENNKLPRQSVVKDTLLSLFLQSSFFFLFFVWVNW